MKFTVFGSSGFIGRAITTYLQMKDIEVSTPAREAEITANDKLGHVIYAIGVTGNFRKDPESAIEAHVNVLQKLIKTSNFESWLYLSSTRMYKNATNTSENAPLPLHPSPDAIYDFSKLLGESICLSHASRNVRVARLSNVYGNGQKTDTFLGSIFHDLKNCGKTTIHENQNSSKDYVSIEDVCEALEYIAIHGKEKIYNVASGKPITHHDLVKKIRDCGFDVELSAQGPMRIFPAIDTSLLDNEFKKLSRSILSDIPDLLRHIQTKEIS